MTIRWVATDPLVMNGEPFCYGSRLTVRNVLEMRANGLLPRRIQVENPELRMVGIAEAFKYAGEHRYRYADYFTDDGSLDGPGFPADEAGALPEHMRGLVGIVVQPEGERVPG